MIETSFEEILEWIWMKQEEGKALLEEILSCDDPKVSGEVLDTMVDEGYISIRGREISLQEKGRKVATSLIRAHRLSERLFNDILEIKFKDLESNACMVEHLLSPEVVDGICILLGHPVECPHGRPIPRGECCSQIKRKVESVIVPLSRLESGSTCKVMYVTAKHHPRMDRLEALGIFPGVELHVHQTYPSFVIQAGETHVALDREILEDVYVRRKHGIT
jgi:DtxR family Mn-dependent transcriptional regulator